MKKVISKLVMHSGHHIPDSNAPFVLEAYATHGGYGGYYTRLRLLAATLNCIKKLCNWICVALKIEVGLPVASV